MERMKASEIFEKAFSDYLKKEKEKKAPAVDNESINEQLAMLERKKEVLNTRDNLNDILRVVNEIIDIYKECGESQKAVNLQVLLTQLELQNEALINRMKGVIND